LLFSYWFDKPRFLIEGKTYWCAHHIFSWGSQQVGHLHQHRTTIKPFSGAVAEEKEDFCKGSLARTIFTLFLFCFTLFLLASFYQKYKKLVPTIVVIFVGLLLSCLIMLSINGWFL
jgi:hypothetical protein